jgi:glutamyl-tRNA synthetase
MERGQLLSIAAARSGSFRGRETVVEELPEEVLASIERNALSNAVRHGGKADVAAVMSKVLGEFPDMKGRAAEVARRVGKEVSRINSLTQEEQRRALEKYPDALKEREKTGREGLPPLPNAARGKTAFRLPPEPSGYMHIGHAMAFTINYIYREEYDGKLWLRFEDTNPRKAAKEYYESFRRGIRWLGIKWDYEKNVSEDLELIYPYGRKLLESGMAYTCSCDATLVKRLRFQGVGCEHRSRAPEENIRVWEGMLSRKYREGQVVVRFKGDMRSADHSLRDPNIFRVIEHTHPVTGDRYTVWPTYDLANTVEDELCGITHVLRSSEFHTELQQRLREALGFRRVEVVQFSRFNFRGTPVQKRLLRPLVEKGLVSGWDDPRMPTVDGVVRRGIVPEAIRQFTLQVGYTRTEHEYDWSLLFAVNRKILDPRARRIFFVVDPVKLTVEGSPAGDVTIPYHPEVDLGSRRIRVGSVFYIPESDVRSLAPGQTFRLMELFNVKLLSTGGEAMGVYDGSELTQGTRKVQWVTEEHTRVRVLIPGPLFDDSGNFNESSLGQVEGLAEKAFDGLSTGEIVQFPRFGFCRVDSPGVCVMAHK